MTNYLAMLKAEIVQTHLLDEPTKPTKRNLTPRLYLDTTRVETFVGFVGAQSRPDGSIELPYASVFAALEGRCPADWQRLTGGKLSRMVADSWLNGACRPRR